MVNDKTSQILSLSKFRFGSQYFAGSYLRRRRRLIFTPLQNYDPLLSQFLRYTAWQRCWQNVTEDGSAVRSVSVRVQQSQTEEDIRGTYDGRASSCVKVSDDLNK